jgi:hypothetical protein
VGIMDTVLQLERLEEKPEYKDEVYNIIHVIL